jgi:site-specific DNA-methyltransferase (adenine-specific)
MGKAFDNLGEGEQQTEWHRRWAREAIRILKPGGHLIAFGGQRTYHRLACALEDVGFEVRDSIHWIFGTGFPKGQNIAKMIDKRAGVKGEVVGKGKGRTGEAAQPLGGSVHSDDSYQWPGEFERREPGTEEAKRWEGWNSTLKPAHEPIVLARKPFKGALVDNVKTHGTGGINVGECRAGKGRGGSRDGESSRERRYADKGSTNFAPTPGPRGGDASGRWPPNVIFFHHPECEFVGREKVRGSNTKPEHIGSGRDGDQETSCYQPHPSKITTSYTDDDGLETVEAWRCHPDCAVRLLGEMSGITRSTGTENRAGSAGVYGDFSGASKGKAIGKGDKGSAARFFPCFHYTAKAASRERWFKCRTCDVVAPGRDRKHHKRDDGHDTTSHPTQKPVKLMRWLVRLVTPPGGVVLDPFLGSGSTGVAALDEGFKFIGFELDPEYFEIASHRIERGGV